MEISNKKLRKALEYYDKRDYKNALRICDKFLAKEYNNEEALMLEGEILYKLGRVDEAIVNWQINYDYNRNSLAKERLEAIDGKTKGEALSYTNLNTISFKAINLDDFENIDEIIKNSNAEPVITEIDKSSTDEKKANAATLKTEKKEKKSSKDNDVDTIKSSQNDNVNSSLAKERAKEFKKLSKGYKVSRKSAFNKKIIAAIIAGIIIVGGGYLIFQNTTKKPAPRATTVTKPKNTWATYNADVSQAISSTNYAELYSLVTKVPEDKVPSDNQKAYKNAVSILQTNGVQAFYDSGMLMLKQKKYTEALSDFQRALAFSTGNYLTPHLIFFAGQAAQNSGNMNDAIQYYKEYLQKYPNSDMYNAECLYILAHYYMKEDNPGVAKTYAQNLENQYPNSPYYNDSIIQIINGTTNSNPNSNSNNN